MASLQPADKDGWCTKQGGSIKTWKRRWFVLKEKRLWYFKGKPVFFRNIYRGKYFYYQQDTEAKGFIELEPGSTVKDESGPKHKSMFSIQSRGLKCFSPCLPIDHVRGRRVFLIKPDTLPEVQEWIDAIKKNIAGSGGVAAPSGGNPPTKEVVSTPGGGAATPAQTQPAPANNAAATPTPQPVTGGAAGGGGGGIYFLYLIC